MLRTVLHNLTHRLLYIITEKRLDDRPVCISAMGNEGVALISVWQRAASSSITRSGTLHYLHLVLVPWWVSVDRAHLWAQSRLVVESPPAKHWTDKFPPGVAHVDRHGVIVEAPGISMLVDAK